MNNKTRSYQLKFWLPISSFVIFASLLTSSIYFNYHYDLALLHQQTEQKIQLQMQRLQLRLEVLLLQKNSSNIEREFSYINLIPQTEVIVLIDNKGKILIANNRSWKNKFAKDLFPEFTLNQFNKAQENFHITILDHNESNRYFVYTPINLPTTSDQFRLHHVGLLYFIYDNSTAYQAILWHTFIDSVLSCVIVMFSMFLLLLFQHFTINNPLNRLIRFTEEMGKGDFSIANPLFGKGELMLLGETLERTSQLLEQREQNLAVTLNSIGDAVITTDIQGRVTRMNPVAEQLTGWLLTEAKGLPLKTIFPIIDASTREPIENPVDKVISTGETIYLSNHTTLIAKDGTEYQIADSAAPIRNTFNNILGMVLVFNDVTEKYQIREQLNRSLQRLSLHWQDTPLGIIELNTAFELVDLNPAAEHMFGFTKAEIHGQHITKNILPETARAAVDKIWADLLTNTGGRRSLNENITKDGRTILCEWYNTPLINEEDKVIGVSSLVMDVTEKQKTEEQLRLSSRVFSDTHEGIIITDAKANIIDVNPAFCHITGYSREEAIGKNPKFLSSGKQSPDFYSDLWCALGEHGHWQGEIWNRKKNDTLYAELLTISAIIDDEGEILQYVGLFSDITHIKQQQEKLLQMAHYDVLTQLPNRVLLEDRYIQAQAHCNRKESLLAVCFLDLDNFKPVNDRYGHGAGDQLLIDVAERIKAVIREEDTVSRQGGDEFALLLGDIESLAFCEQLLERILHSLAQPYFIDDQSVSISASIGVSLYPKDDANLDTLMRHADQAMYQAKIAGRNNYSFFNAEQNQRTIQKNNQLKELKNALLNNEFCLYYQPKVDMRTGKVFGAEALIRWLHPKKGLIPPLKFLPVIEDTELEILIGDWVIDEALKQLDKWKNQGINLEVSINISSYHLQSPLFVANMAHALARFPNVDSSTVQLEILESSALGDIKSISHIIQTCMHTLGINIALDDFGTGYSSLTHLKNLFAKTIKIDQSFVRDVLDDPSDYAIIDGIIGLAHSFYRDVIAEGVETTEHGLMLLIMGCHNAQGYGIAKPMPASDFPNWLDNYIPNQEWLAYGKKVRTQKETRIKLCRLTLKQWQEHFEFNIQSSPDKVEHWPIPIKTKCHCGVWIKRAKEDQLIEENCLKILENQHNSMHTIADNLFNKYQKGEFDAARDGLTLLRTVFEKITHVLEQCE